jgi:two-component system chemotaxis response regulator CheB
MGPIVGAVTHAMTSHDRLTGVVLIGGSAGALEPLITVLGGLPVDLPATVCVVLHRPAQSRTSLPEILRRIRGHDVAMATDGEVLRGRMVRVAVPDRHLAIRDDRLSVFFGPREHRLRPAIDPLFRTAARSHGRRVTSVVLSGTLDDGAAGSASVGLRGGLTIAQDPAEAMFGDMPANAIATGQIGHVASVRDIPSIILDRLDRLSEAPVDPPGDPSPSSCPDCGGVLWTVEGAIEQVRCRVGHRFTREALENEHERVIEDALWTALRAVPDITATRSGGGTVT